MFIKFVFGQISVSWDLISEKLAAWAEQFVLLLPNIGLSILVMVLTIILSGYIGRLLKKGIGKFVDSEALKSLFSKVGATLFVLAGLAIVLSILDLDQALYSMLAGAGVVGLAVGLALQDPLINIFSSVLLSTRKTDFNIGDFVDTNGHLGTIERIGLRTTTLRGILGTVITIPNRKIVQETYTNYAEVSKRKVEVECGVSYDDDLEKVQEIAVSTVKKLFNQEDTDQPIDFFFTGFGNSSIDFTMRFPLAFHPEMNFMVARSQAIIALKKAFDQAGINIPFPIRTLDFGGKTVPLAQADMANGVRE